MQINLSQQCINELAEQLAPIVFREDFKEGLYNNYLDANSIHIDDEDFERFVDDVYEKFQIYHNGETSWDDALASATDKLFDNGDYVLYNCDDCGKQVIIRGDDASKHEDYDGYRYCKDCFKNHFIQCHKCGHLENKDNHFIVVHGHHYCNYCAQELLTHLMQPDVNQTTNE